MKVTDNTEKGKQYGKYHTPREAKMARGQHR